MYYDNYFGRWSAYFFQDDPSSRKKWDIKSPRINGLMLTYVIKFSIIFFYVLGAAPEFVAYLYR